MSRKDHIGAMRQRLLRVLAVLAAALPLIPLFAFEVPAQGRLTLVELYTAQGCATCPPADAYLADLAERSDVLALSFHVDYWDYIGWKDPFADAAHTRRQQAYADRHGLP